MGVNAYIFLNENQKVCEIVVCGKSHSLNEQGVWARGEICNPLSVAFQFVSVHCMRLVNIVNRSSDWCPSSMRCAVFPCLNLVLGLWWRARAIARLISSALLYNNNDVKYTQLPCVCLHTDTLFADSCSLYVAFPHPFPTLPLYEMTTYFF